MNSPRTSLIITALIPVLSFISPLAHAADIAWDTPVQIAGDSDVSTTGTLVGAANVGDNSASTTSTTVNGVLFQPLQTISGTGASGIFAITPTPATGTARTEGHDNGSAAAPFANLSAAYKALLSTASIPYGDPINLVISGLTIGAQYQFQWWSNLSNGMFGGQTTATSGATSVTLNGNDNAADGGLGEWVTGSFKADGATETITFQGDGDYGNVNGFQLRQLTPHAPGVPDSGSTILLLGCATGAIALARRRFNARAALRA